MPHCAYMPFKFDFNHTSIRNYTRVLTCYYSENYVLLLNNIKRNIVKIVPCVCLTRFSVQHHSCFAKCKHS